MCACCAHRVTPLLWGHCGLIRTDGHSESLRAGNHHVPVVRPSLTGDERTAKMLLLLLTSLVCLSPGALGQLEESQFGDEIDLTDFDLDIVRELKFEAHSGVSGFLYLTLFVHTGATQSPTAGENYASQGKSLVFRREM